MNSTPLCGTSVPALAIRFAPDEFVWGLAAIAQLLRRPFDPALALAASPPPLTLASFIPAARAIGARGEPNDLSIEPGGGVALL